MLLTSAIAYGGQRPSFILQLDERGLLNSRYLARGDGVVPPPSPRPPQV